MDKDAIPLHEYLGVMCEHFERWAPENTYKAMHIKKVLRCNWKLAHEAFIESLHTLATHSRGYQGSYLAGQESRTQRLHELVDDYIEGRRQPNKPG